MEKQLSIFEMLDQYETPEIPPEMQKKDTKGWIIEGSGIFLTRNGFDHDWRGVCTRPIIFEADTYKDRRGEWNQWAHTTKGPYSGWVGGTERIFRSRPTWADCLRWAAETRSESDPEEVGYYEILGDWAGAKYEW